MSGSISPAYKDALRTLSTAARSMGQPELVPPVTLRDDEAIRAWLSERADAFKKARRSHAQELAICEAKVAAGRTAGRDTNVAVWRALEDAVNKLENELVSMSSLKARLAEGRRSMSAKAARVVEEHLNVQTEVIGGRVEASLDAAGVARLQTELPQWVLGWADYGYRAYAVDLHRTTERLWLSRSGALPVAAPTLEPLQLPTAPSPPEFPVITQTADLEGMGGIFKHARSVLYGVMSLGFLFGLRSGDNEHLFKMLMPPIFLAAAVYGYWQLQAERGERIERFEAEVSRRAEQAVKDVLRTWYDRQADKLLDHAVAQLHQRRAALIQWYQADVLPAKRRTEESTSNAQQEASRAQSRLGALQRQKTDHQKAKAALATILG